MSRYANILKASFFMHIFAWMYFSHSEFTIPCTDAVLLVFETVAENNGK